MSKRTCSIDGCDKTHYARGWCESHYGRWRRSGAPEPAVKRAAECSVEGCVRPPKSRGKCSSHYKQWLASAESLHVLPGRDCRAGSCELPAISKGLCRVHHERVKRNGTLGTTRVRLKGMTLEQVVRKFSEPDGDHLVWTHQINPNGYGTFNFEGKRWLAHRAAWIVENGPIPDGLLIDHQCWVRNCVKVEHLRLANKSENGSHRSPESVTSKTGVRNVHVSRGGRFVVTMSENNKGVYIGTYDTIEEAEAVAKAERRQRYGDYAGASRA